MFKHNQITHKYQNSNKLLKIYKIAYKQTHKLKETTVSTIHENWDVVVFLYSNKLQFNRTVDW